MAFSQILAIRWWFNYLPNSNSFWIKNQVKQDRSYLNPKACWFLKTILVLNWFAKIAPKIQSYGMKEYHTKIKMVGNIQNVSFLDIRSSRPSKGPANLKTFTTDLKGLESVLILKLNFSLSVSLPTRLFDYYYGRCVQCTYELITHN